MEPRTSRKDYRSHLYSGPRKNRNRINGQMKRYHGRVVSRNEVWCKKKNTDNVSDASKLNAPEPTLRTYGASKKKFVTEATFVNTQQQNGEEKLSDPIDLNTPVEAENNDDSFVDELLVNDTSINPDPLDLSSISGRRIVDLSHVLQWAFELEKHRSNCSSSICLIEESKDGFHSTFHFKCSVCEQSFNYSNENEENLNRAFVCGTLKSGNYYTQAAKLTNLMGIPTISKDQFFKIEENIGDAKKSVLTAFVNREER